MPVRFVSPAQRYEHYGPVKLYQEDIEEIARVFAGRGATFVFNEYASKDPALLMEKYRGSKLEKLEVYCENPSVSMHIGRGEINRMFYLDDLNADAAGIRVILHNLLKNAERSARLVYWWVPLAGILITTLLMVAHKGPAGEGVGDMVLTVYVSILAVLALLLFRNVYIGACKNATILVSSRYKQRGFFERNGDKIIRDALVSAMSVAGTLLAQYIIEQLGH